MVREHACNHFAFSYRTMSMGVEQFVWNRLRTPHVHVVGDVISSLHSVSPNWIEIVDDVYTLDAAELDQSSKKLKICLRGGCDFTSMEHYFRTKHDLINEFPFAFKTWAITPWARTVALAEGASTSRGQELLKKNFCLAG